jgi:adhesin/invasin
VTCIAVAGLMAALALPILSTASSRAAGAPARTFTVNSTALIEANASCSPGGVCTLGQALAEANVVPEDQDVLINVDENTSGFIPFPNDTKQLAVTTPVSPWDTAGAVFSAQRPMTIDLDNRLSLVTPDGKEWSAVAGLWVDGPDVALRNFTNWYSYQSAIVFSPNSDGSSLQGGKSIQYENNHTDREIAIVGGAERISISDYTTGRQLGRDTGGGIVFGKLTSLNEPVKNVTITQVTVDNGPDARGCGEDAGTSCMANGLAFSGSVDVDGLTVKNSLFTNFVDQKKGQPIYAVNAGKISNWDITGNQFTNISTGGDFADATVAVKYTQSFGGTVRIANNTFDSGTVVGTTSTPKYGLYVEGNQANDSTVASGLFVEDNYFDGYKSTSIYLRGTGTATVRRNTFGVNSASRSSTDLEETTDSSAGTMVLNFDKSANRKIKPWYPTGTASYNGACALVIPISPPASDGKANLPNDPVSLDYYWTAGTTAEVYLETVKPSTAGAPTTLTVLPPTAGKIRIQTQGFGSQPESSQYSRTVAVTAPPAVCVQPAVSLKVEGWTDVPDGVTDYDGIVASATPLPRGGTVSLAPGEVIWYTYTAQNTGKAVLTDVEVKDVSGKRICVLPQLAAGQAAGCAKPELVPGLNASP